MKHKASRVAIYALLIIGALTMLLPFYWMIISAFKTPEQIAQMPPLWFPTSFRLDNFEYAMTYAAFGRYIFNSLLVTVCNMVCTMVILFIFARKYIITAMARGGIKG